MTDQGYHKTQAYHSVFMKKFHGRDFLILLLYMDDVLIFGQDREPGMPIEEELIRIEVSSRAMILEFGLLMTDQI